MGGGIIMIIFLKEFAMRTIAKIMSLSALLLFLSGCATIVGDKSAKFDLQSNPSSANVVITDKATNTIVMDAVTPFSVKLEKKQAYFEGKVYSVVVKKSGYNSVKFDIEPKAGGWYIAGNLFFGGLLGWLVVDPLTGAMWNLEPQESDNVNFDENTITIKLISDLTQNEMKRLKKIN